MVLEPTGWYSYDEFAPVFAQLQHPEEYGSIATRIALWKSRAKVPAAVTATESLISAVVADHQGAVSESGLRSLYAMAVIRAVNLLLDHEQDREYARSLRALAKECELPEYIITVRHESSHREIPDLNTLRLAAFDAINYVYNKYWSAQYKSIMFKLDNAEYDALSMSLILLCSYSAALTEIPPGSVDPCHLWALYPAGPTAQPWAPFLRDPVFRSALLGARRLASNARRRSYLSGWRRGCSKSLIPNKQSPNQDTTLALLLVLQASNLARRLIEGCVHTSFFVSVFVEFVFAHFEPSPSSLFLVILLEVLAQLPFNFAAELAAATLSVVFDLPDGISAARDSQAPLYFEQMALYYQFLSTPAASYVRRRLAGHTFRHQHADPGTSRLRVNGWLILLLESATRFDNKDQCHKLPACIQVLACGGAGKSQRLWMASGNALQRFARAVYELLPHAALQTSARVAVLPSDQRRRFQPWESDRLSHALGLHSWLNGFYASGCAQSYVFLATSTAVMRQTLDALRSASQRTPFPLDVLLLPGTLWDPVRWRIQYTVRRLDESNAGRCRLSSALEVASGNCPVRLCSKSNRKLQRFGHRLAQSPATRALHCSPFVNVCAQLATYLKQLSYRERYS
ncbi:Las1-like family protein [Babesia caballi]|uniref:Las1-like family protein n=1 Tax=Babesia caballi TaxID=5871 RepID=A0AAV4LWM0_BABCB|nr:Las1-like family protein [Babesia caballi]